MRSYNNRNKKKRKAAAVQQTLSWPPTVEAEPADLTFSTVDAEKIADWKSPELTDFVLKFHYKASPDKDSKIAVSSQAGVALGGSTGDIYAQGDDLDESKIQCAADQKAKRQAGAVWIERMADGSAKADDWNAMKIVARGDTLTVFINGEAANHVAGIPAGGQISFADLGESAQVKDIEFAELATK